MKMTSIKGRVLKVSRSKSNPGDWFSARVDCGNGRSMQVKGFDASINVGELIEFHGQLEEDPTWGPSLKVQSLIRIEGSSPLELSGKDAVTALSSPALLILSQGVIKGVGPARARKLIEANGELGAIEQALKGSKKKTPFGHARELLRLGELMALGLSLRQAERVSKEFGPTALDTLKRHPYLLLRVDGIGFKFADDFAINAGISADDRGRCAAGLNFSIERACKAGNTGILRKDLLQEASSLLGLPSNSVLEDVLLGLESPSRAGSKVIGGDLNGAPVVFDRSLREKEIFIAQDLKSRLVSAKPPKAKEIQAQLALIQKMLGFGLHFKQQEAVTRAAIEAVFVMTGGPGTGKTTTIRAIFDLLRQRGLRVALTAPTGKAAQRLGQACNSQESKTLHRLLEWHGKGDFKQNKENPLEVDAVIVDETSMVDVPLMFGLLQALKKDTKLILVGDKDQLPSVGPGQILHDLLASDAIPSVTLERGFRQGIDSSIATSATSVNAGEIPNPQPPEFEIVAVEEGSGEDERASDLVLATIARLIDEGCSASQIQVLSPKREEGACAAHVLSRKIQALVSPQSEKSLNVGAWTFRLGDRVINTQNNYSPELMLANGDTGVVFDIDENEESITIQVDGDRRVVLKEGPLQELELSYAITVHKSQGSEFPIVIVPIISAHRVLLTKRLLYTAMTRARERLILVAGKNALSMTVKASSERPRVTSLAQILKNKVSH